jgi:hypothetical protein
MGTGHHSLSQPSWKGEGDGREDVRGFEGDAGDALGLFEPVEYFVLVRVRWSSVARRLRFINHRQKNCPNSESPKLPHGGMSGRNASCRATLLASARCTSGPQGRSPADHASQGAGVGMSHRPEKPESIFYTFLPAMYSDLSTQMSTKAYISCVSDGRPTQISEVQEFRQQKLPVVLGIRQR